MNESIPNNGRDLVKFESLEGVFNVNGSDDIVQKVVAAVIAQPKHSPEHASGRKEIKSLVYKIRRTKTFLDDLGKQKVEIVKRPAVIIDAERKKIRDSLDKIIVAVMKPLREWEREFATKPTLAVQQVENKRKINNSVLQSLLSKKLVPDAGAGMELIKNIANGKIKHLKIEY